MLFSKDDGRLRATIEIAPYGGYLVKIKHRGEIVKELNFSDWQAAREYIKTYLANS